MSRPALLGGLAALAVVALIGAVIVFIVLPAAEDSPLLTATPEPSNGQPAPGNGGEFPELDPPPGEAVQPPPEAMAFVESFDAAGMTLHLSIAEERHPALTEPGGRLSVLGDVWVELDDAGVPQRFVARYYDDAGALLQAVYQDLEGEIVAYIEEARLLGEDSPGCMQELAGDPRQLAFSLPFVLSNEAMTADGFEATPETPPGEAPTTQVDGRVGEPERVVDLAPWADTSAYTLIDPASGTQQFVLLDPQHGILVGQAAMQANEDGDLELAYRQSIGDIHLHATGTASAAFDIADAIAACDELES
jgi:hypothetical protein